MCSSFTIFIAFEQIKDNDNVFSLTVFTRIIRLRRVIYLQSLSSLSSLLLSVWRELSNG